MKWFDKWFAKKVAEANEVSYDSSNDTWANQSGNIKIPRGLRKSSTMTDSIDSHGFNIKVHKANGGTIVQTSTYDDRSDRHTNGVYIITDEKDLGEELGKIITMEGLRA